jgi:hypothetical protein
VLVIASNELLRLAGGASSVLVDVYIADLANRGLPLGAGSVGTLAAIVCAPVECVASPVGMPIVRSQRSSEPVPAESPFVS